MNKGNDPRKALGKGLSALFPGKPAAVAPVLPPPTPEPQNDDPTEVAIDAIDPNPVQPRVHFQAERIEELAQSIRLNGIIQPLIVQRANDRYQLIAGERRWRAAKVAGLTKVPVVVREIASEQLLQVALIENIQREDLNPIEVAQAIDRLVRELQISHEEVGRRTGKDRSTITNLLRLLKLPSDIQTLVAEQRLSMGHARALLSLPEERLQRDLAQRIVAEGLSVRQVERLSQAVTSERQPAAGPGTKTEATEKHIDPNVAAATRELEGALGTRVRIVSQDHKRGRIEIEYFSPEELDRIYKLIVGNE